MSDGEIVVRVNSYGRGRPLGLVWFDPVTGKKVAKSAGTTSRKDAERQAGILEAELRAGRHKSASQTTWKEFRERYEREHLAGLSPKSLESAASALNHVERVLNPDRLVKLTTAVMSKFSATLREDEGMRDTTLGSHLRGIKAALNWAVAMGMLAVAPAIQIPRKAKGQSLARSCAVVAEQYERMLAVAPKVRPKDSAAWVHYLQGLWLSGLRLEESLALSWDDDAPMSVCLTGRRPALRIFGEVQKSGRDQVLPLTPDFAEFLLQTPPDQRHGKVFVLRSLLDGAPLVPAGVGQVVGQIGARAGVVTNKAEGKTATAHDLRRSFASRWAPRVKPLTLQLLMRHSSLTTTLRYYVFQDAADVADELWAGWGNTGQESNRGNTLGSNGPDDAKKAEGAPDAATSETPCGYSLSESGGQGIRTLNRLPGT